MAVPAMTAVRATPRSRGISISSQAVGRVERGSDGVLGNVTGGDELGVPTAQALDEGRGPAVLEDQDGAGGPGRDHERRIGQVAVPHEPRGRAFEDGDLEVPSWSRSASPMRPSEPSGPLVTNTKSRILITPWSTRSIRMGKPSPVILEPGNSTTR